MKAMLLVGVCFLIAGCGPIHYRPRGVIDLIQSLPF